MILTTREPVGTINGYHAHVYYDERTRPVAAQLRDALALRFAVSLGRWHDQPIGRIPQAAIRSRSDRTCSPSWYPGSRSTARG